MSAVRVKLGRMTATPIPRDRPPLAATAAQTTAHNPWPLRLLSTKIADYVNRMSALWVEGQLVEINRRPGGPMAFMTLRDTDVDMSIPLVISARDLAASAATLTDGVRVVVRAKPTFWAKRGSLQLQASEIRPVGLGELLARIEHLKKVLAGEGLFDAARKRTLPFLPGTIGLICGRESKAEHDVVVNATARWPEARFRIREVAVQGPAAVAEVSHAIAELDADPEIEVIVVARGGGSVEDLLPFSNEGLLRVAAACRTPLVSAIGHETDAPLLDLVADLRCSTPTDAGKRIVPDVVAERRALTQAQGRMRAAVAALLDREQHRLDSIRTRPVMANPALLVDPHCERVRLVRREVRRAFELQLDRAAAQLARLHGQLLALSPAATLQRGYAVVRDPAARHVLTDAAAVPTGSVVEILLAHGRLDATISASHPTTFDPDHPPREETDA